MKIGRKVLKSRRKAHRFRRKAPRNCSAFRREKIGEKHFDEKHISPKNVLQKIVAGDISDKNVLYD